MDALVSLIETLRGENGCPWDKKQTPQTMAVYLVEEMYELIEAIDEKDPDDVCEELGDVLFHIMFMAYLFHEKGHFSINDVIQRIVKKMIRRHPHVFDDAKIESAEEVKQQWHQIKQKEKQHDSGTSILDTIPGALPALMRAYRMSERAAKAGFDWDNVFGVMDKLKEELDELKTEIGNNRKDRIEMEFGDLFFTLVNIARFLSIHPETALKGAIQRFEGRFRKMEKIISESGRQLESVAQNEMDAIWETCKAPDGQQG